MDLMSLFWFLVIGALAGWLAGVIMKGKGFGILINMIVGIAGSFIGGWLFGLLGIHTTGPKNLGTLVTSFVGAVILLYLVNLIKKK